MKITDAPFAAGTPEHSAWVRDVFIPTVNRVRSAEDAEKYGAASIGGKLVIGDQQPSLWRAPNRPFQYSAIVDQHGNVIELADAYKTAFNDVASFFASFEQSLQAVQQAFATTADDLERFAYSFRHKSGANRQQRRAKVPKGPRQVAGLGLGWQARAKVLSETTGQQSPEHSTMTT